ncbi:PREDICTED: uncharacterized protein LOC105563292 [Vollenhovia emeryi]|uniref:uncharacterized protein LOC105563292 n=1 Tax=Vollenhovia emeryi TaxID=411798 RepID=UPI0005F4B865|nr:PREDICTED: uncharacterized protein LOC105563292 [Vollenhovia emeryi]
MKDRIEHGTPKKVDKPTDSYNTNKTTWVNTIDCANENINSPQKDKYLVDHENLLTSPKRWNKSVDTCPQRERTISTNIDYDTFQLELSSMEKSNFDTIYLLHNSNSAIKFEDTNDILSTMMDVDTMQENDSLLGANKDPATDPLSISDCDKKDPDTAIDSDSKLSRKRKISVESKSQVKRRSKRRCTKNRLSIKEEQLMDELEKFEEWERMPLSEIKKLMDLRVKLIHKVPPQHKIELSGSHAPTRIEKILFLKHGPIRKGLYTPTEDENIRKNWEMFCKLHDWNRKKTQPFLHWRHDGRYYIQDVEERQKFVQFLANKLPWRTLYSVYSRFKVLYRNKITYSRYTPKEDKKILMYIHNERLDKRDNKYTELGKLLKRTSRSVFKRYRFLKNRLQDNSERTPLTDVKWTLPLIKKYIKTLLSLTLSDDIRELKGAILPKPVWQKMEEKLNIHHNVLRTFWQHQLHLQLFSTEPIYLNDIKIQLIEYMYAKGISNTREIIWPNVAKHFDGATAVFLCKVLFYLVQECNMSNVDNFAAVVRHLYRTKIPEIRKAPTDKFLPKIIYKYGKISLVNKNSSKTILADTDQQESDHTDSTYSDS